MNETIADAAAPAAPVRRGWRRFPRRLVGAAGLDREIYAEIEGDRGALAQAALVVALAGAARGLAAVVAGEPIGVAGSVIIAFVSWLIVTTGIWFVGVVLDHDTSSFTELLRTVGFAASPIILLLVGALPVFAEPGIVRVLEIVTHAAAVAALVIAAREALDISTARALVFCGGILGALALLLAYVIDRIVQRLAALLDIAISAATHV